MSLTYVDRIVAPLVAAGCIATLIANLKLPIPSAVRHPAALALLNITVHDRYKVEVAQAGGVEAAVALLGSNDPEVQSALEVQRTFFQFMPAQISGIALSLTRGMTRGSGHLRFVGLARDQMYQLP